MKWISVKDQLPEKEVYVLVITKEKAYAIAFLSQFNGKKEWSIFDTHWIDFEDVTHWMPLPEKPENK